MTLAIPVKTYFDERTEAYDAKTHRWPARRLESEAVLALLGEIKDQTVLELCCGSGFYTEKLAKRNPKRLVALDFSYAMLRRLKAPRAFKIQADAAQWHLRESFDTFLCAGGLEFMDDPEDVFRCARLAAKEGSRFIGLVPPRSVAGECYKLFHRNHGFGIHLFHKEEIARHAEAAGWRLRLYKKIHLYADLFELVTS